MALADYSELRAAVQRWLWNRSDLVDTIPEFIRLAEAQMLRRLNVREMEREVTLFTNGGEAKLPCDFVEVRSLREAGGERFKLINVTISQIEDRPDTQNPRVMEYAISGDRLLVWPRKDTELRLVYRARFKPLSDDFPNNWLLEKHPDAYLYGASLQGAVYLQENEQIPVWERGFIEALSAINEDGRRSRTGAQAQISPNGVVV